MKIITPCELNDIVYVIPTVENGLKCVVEMDCLGFSVSAVGILADLFSRNRADKTIPKMYQPSIEQFGKTIFLNRLEAELVALQN